MLSLLGTTILLCLFLKIFSVICKNSHLELLEGKNNDQEQAEIHMDFDIPLGRKENNFILEFGIFKGRSNVTRVPGKVEQCGLILMNLHCAPNMKWAPYIDML